MASKPVLLAFALALLACTGSPARAVNDLVGDSIELIQMRAGMYGMKVTVELPTAEELERIGKLPAEGRVLILWNGESAVFVVAREGIIAYSSDSMSKSEVDEALGRNPT